MSCYKRILLKISGETLKGDKSYGLDLATVVRVAQDVKNLMYNYRYGKLQICIVLGGGNIYRGVSGAAQGMKRASADYIGMLATVINALAFQNALETLGVDARVMSAIDMPTVCQRYIRQKALKHLSIGRVVIFAGGSGNPFFTTDTAAALRACEMECDVLLKGTKVDGIFDCDPVKNEQAKFIPHLTYSDVLSNNLDVMDRSAITLVEASNIPVIVFSIEKAGNLIEVLHGNGKFTVVKNDEVK